MWDETSRDETSSGTKYPGAKHPRYETEMVRNIQHPVYRKERSSRLSSTRYTNKNKMILFYSYDECCKENILKSFKTLTATGDEKLHMGRNLLHPKRKIESKPRQKWPRPSNKANPEGCIDLINQFALCIITTNLSLG